MDNESTLETKIRFLVVVVDVIVDDVLVLQLESLSITFIRNPKLGGRPCQIGS